MKLNPMEGYTFRKSQHDSQISVASLPHKTTLANNSHLTKLVCFKEYAKIFILCQRFLLKFYSVCNLWF